MAQPARPIASKVDRSAPGGAPGLDARYERFMSQPSVRSFVHRRGQVFLATERQPASSVRSLIALGHRHFAEKYVQEAGTKWPVLRAATPGLRLNDFGRLQTNKVRPALALFDAIESVDRPSLARALQRRIPGTVTSPTLYIQVNTGKEPQKGGVLPEELERFAAYCRDDLGLAVAGLMAIPPRGADPWQHFRLLRRLADGAQLEGCCMGMSDDFQVAIRCGATAIRIGRAVFDASGE
jgi:pyridoxal phosphate enzyme (YggS family)